MGRLRDFFTGSKNPEVKEVIKVARKDPEEAAKIISQGKDPVETVEQVVEANSGIATEVLEEMVKIDPALVTKFAGRNPKDTSKINATGMAATAAQEISDQERREQVTQSMVEGFNKNQFNIVVEKVEDVEEAKRLIIERLMNTYRTNKGSILNQSELVNNLKDKGLVIDIVDQCLKQIGKEYEKELRPKQNSKEELLKKSRVQESRVNLIIGLYQWAKDAEDVDKNIEIQNRKEKMIDQYIQDGIFDGGGLGDVIAKGINRQENRYSILQKHGSDVIKGEKSEKGICFPEEKPLLPDREQNKILELCDHKYLARMFVEYRKENPRQAEKETKEVKKEEQNQI